MANLATGPHSFFKRSEWAEQWHSCIEKDHHSPISHVVKTRTVLNFDLYNISREINLTVPRYISFI